MGAIAASRYSERPGFTLIGGLPSLSGPVAVRHDGTRASFTALRTAVDQAMTRTCGLVVFDETGLLESADPEGLDDRERSVAKGILANSHVSQMPLDPPGLPAAIEACTALRASLLVLNEEETARVFSSPNLLASMGAAPCDFLFLSSRPSLEDQVD
jgi:hypothetical protein